MSGGGNGSDEDRRCRDSVENGYFGIRRRGRETGIKFVVTGYNGGVVLAASKVNSIISGEIAVVGFL